MDKVYQPEPLNQQASVLIDAQTDIKLAVKNGILSGKPSFVIKAKITEIITKALREINSPTLRENARKSLMQFADKAYMQLKTVLPNPAMALAFYTLIKAIGDKKNKTFFPKNFAERSAVKAFNGGYFYSDAKGLPIRDFEPAMQRVKTALDELAMSNALDADDIRGRNSLRSFAEMQIRYERHLEEIETLKKDGVKLVICSVHADCSERCKQWQGRVYSLDGTYGVTDDGREYVPLEVATDIYYTTKAGKTYKNGLLGFNCRHKLLPYKSGMVAPRVSETVRKKEDYITRTQRAMERSVLRWREKALMHKGVNVPEYKTAREKAVKAYERYKAFSKENGRAYYPDRVKIL